MTNTGEGGEEEGVGKEEEEEEEKNGRGGVGSGKEGGGGGEVVGGEEWEEEGLVLRMLREFFGICLAKIMIFLRIMKQFLILIGSLGK